jgi:sarcosine oxidase subunit gamma
MQSPLHGFGLAEQARPKDASCGVWANEIPLLGYVSLRGNAWDVGFVGAVSSVLGVQLPTEPCTYATSATAKALWLSPDEWMIVCPRAGLGSLIGDLGQALAGIRSQVVDNSGGYTQVLLLGARATDVLSHTTVYDIGSLAQGRVVGTTFGKSSLYLHRQGDGYCLLFRRSFADYIWRYLVRAAEPYGFGVVKIEADAPGLERAAA